MPTISQLPSSDQVTAAFKIPVSQAGATHAVTVGTLLASTQPAVISASGTLLGRISTGPGGPESIAVGLGLLLNDGTVAASGADHATYPVQTDLTPTDQVVLNSAGNPKLLSSQDRLRVKAATTALRAYRPSQAWPRATSSRSVRLARIIRSAMPTCWTA